MQQLKFLCVTQDNSQLCADFSALMFPYSEELDEDLDEKLPAEILQKWIDSILRMQGDSDRHLELCYDGDALIGFLYGKVDHPEHRGYIKPGYGYIMEFYVRPEYRRKGYGTKLYQRMEELFRNDGTSRLYLTTGTKTGIPFWRAMGFSPTGEICPENQMEIYEKKIRL